MINEKEMKAALHAVELASELCQKVRASLVNEDTVAKKDKSPVTVADYGAQAIIIDYLSKQFPDIPFVAEEDSGDLESEEQAALRGQISSYVSQVEPSLDESAIMEAIAKGNHKGGSKGRFWTLDPIDGTKGFLRNDQYAIALALIENGQVVLGVLGCPNLPVDPSAKSGECGALFYASRSEGAFTRAISGGEARPIHVAETSDPSQASFCESVESGHTRHDASAQIVKQLGVKAEPVRIDSQCKYAAVARGEACVYLRLQTRPGYQEKIWDHAAGVVVLEEAGGYVCDTEGKPLDFSIGTTLSQNCGVVATTVALREPVVAAVKHVLHAQTT